MEKEQTDIRTDKDRQPARGKGEGGEGEGRYMPVTASSCPHKKQMKIKMQMKYKIIIIIIIACSPVKSNKESNTEFKYSSTLRNRLLGTPFPRAFSIALCSWL